MGGKGLEMAKFAWISCVNFILSYPYLTAYVCMVKRRCKDGRPIEGGIAIYFDAIIPLIKLYRERGKKS